MGTFTAPHCEEHRISYFADHAHICRSIAEHLKIFFTQFHLFLK